MLEDTRVALCRCGMSANKPFCDNTHRREGFADAGSVPGDASTDATTEPGPLTITPLPREPLALHGRFELASADGQHVVRGEKATLCRCGGSRNKPFCDGTHRKRVFER